MDANKFRELMGKVESGDYEEGSVDSSLLEQKAVEATPEMLAQQSMEQHHIEQPTSSSTDGRFRNGNSKVPDFIKEAMASTPAAGVGDVMYKNMGKSKMPDFIKEAMLNKPIDPNNPNNNFIQKTNQHPNNKKRKQRNV